MKPIIYFIRSLGMAADTVTAQHRNYHSVLAGITDFIFSTIPMNIRGYFLRTKRPRLEDDDSTRECGGRACSS
jgi:hypothetical protein